MLQCDAYRCTLVAWVGGFSGFALSSWPGPGPGQHFPGTTWNHYDCLPGPGRSRLRAHSFLSTIFLSLSPPVRYSHWQVRCCSSNLVPKTNIALRDRRATRERLDRGSWSLGL